ncbi:MAG: CHAT domain-containing protein [Deltaproteobacteria bacterium]|jgi:CHAT domain-containing protein/tetratricopeptide (TPR) repeat protein|nr:CHAT domain-containing protein [Deltaproteobacteria bacterium]
MKYLYVIIVCVISSIITSHVQAQDYETPFLKAQEYFKVGNLDAAADEFLEVVSILREMKKYNEARQILGNVAVIRIQQERFEEAISLYEEALDLPGTVSPEILIKFTENIVFSADKALNHMVKADSIDRLFGAKVKLSPEVIANYLAVQGDAYRAMGLYGSAVESYSRALKNKNYPKEKMPALLTSLGLAQGNLGQYQEALKNLEQATKEAENVNDKTAIVESLSNTGIIYWEMGQLPKALDTLNLAQGKAREFKMRRNEGIDFNNIGAVYKTAGQWPKAIASFDSAYGIAKEVGNRRDEAIALSNRALLERLNGDQDAALKDYTEALSIYQEVKFFEGVGSTLMGLAAIDSLNKNYGAALQKLLQAKEIFERQELASQTALVYIQLGLLYQNTAKPVRRTRDLVFEDDEEDEIPSAPNISNIPNIPNNTKKDQLTSGSSIGFDSGSSKGITKIDLSADRALVESENYFKKAEDLAVKFSLTQSLWKAIQGRAFAANERGDLVESEELYTKAIDIVLSIRGLEENPELLLTYLNDKEDLFSQAIEVCSLLFKKTKDQKYLIKQMEYDEIFKKEIVKANLQMSNLNFNDNLKQENYEKIYQKAAELKKAENAVANAKAVSDGQKNDKRASDAYKVASKIAIKTAEEFKKDLANWKETYSNDIVIFETSETIDIPSLQKKLNNNEAIVQYFPLQNSLQILVITNDQLNIVDVNISYEQLFKAIYEDYTMKYIGGFGTLEKPSNQETEDYFVVAIDALEKLNEYLYAPIRSLVEGKERIYLLTTKIISSVPFAALVIGRSKDGNDPVFLVSEKTLIFTRLSFFNNASFEKKDVGNVYDSLISVGNPENIAMRQADLVNAAVEAENVYNYYNNARKISKVLIREKATKKAFLDEIIKHPYNVMYFATHGLTAPEVKADYTRCKKMLDGRIKPPTTDLERLKKFKETYDRCPSTIPYVEEFLPNSSYLNSFIYMAYNHDNPKTVPIAYKKILDNGALTLREITELEDEIFKNATLAILSACNTAVSINPRILHAAYKKLRKDDADKVLTDDEIDSEQTSDISDEERKAIKDAEWNPGFDQVCLVDTFMRKNFKNVFGTLWFVSDESTRIIMGKFLEYLNTGTDNKDPAEALRKAQNDYLDNVGDTFTVTSQDGTQETLKLYVHKHPFYWAAGNIFGL